MAFEAVLRMGRWMIVSGPIEFGPYSDEALARSAADEINASNLRRMLTGSAAPATLSQTPGGKAPRR